METVELNCGFEKEGERQRREREKENAEWWDKEDEETADRNKRKEDERQNVKRVENIKWWCGSNLISSCCSAAERLSNTTYEH